MATEQIDRYIFNTNDERKNKSEKKQKNKWEKRRWNFYVRKSQKEWNTSNKSSGSVSGKVYIRKGNTRTHRWKQHFKTNLKISIDFVFTQGIHIRGLCLSIVLPMRLSVCLSVCVSASNRERKSASWNISIVCVYTKHSIFLLLSKLIFGFFEKNIFLFRILLFYPLNCLAGYCCCCKALHLHQDDDRVHREQWIDFNSSRTALELYGERFVYIGTQMMAKWASEWVSEMYAGYKL